MKSLITRKIGMTSIIGEDGVVAGVTLLSATDNTVLQLKNNETDGYCAVQLGAETSKHLAKPQIGHVKKAKTTPKVIKEFRVTELPEGLEVGNTINLETFSVGDKVNVTGKSKGKGFAGTIKRHNFHQQRRSHGGNGNVRKPGSIGSMYPQHVFKGHKMAGQMGHEQVTTKNLKIGLIDTEKNVIGVIGSVPGPRKSVVILRSAK